MKAQWRLIDIETNDTLAVAEIFDIEDFIDRTWIKKEIEGMGGEIPVGLLPSTKKEKKP